MASVSDLQDLCLFKDGGLVGPCGRWQWTSGKLKRNGTISWNVQCMPLDDKHFVHHKVHLRCFCKHFRIACKEPVISLLTMGWDCQRIRQAWLSRRIALQCW